MALNLGNALSLYAIFAKGLDFALGVIPLFNFDEEANFPTLFNGVLLAGASFWAFSIARWSRLHGGDLHRFWFALGGVLAFLCLDELCHIHETLDWILKTRIETSGYLAWPWVMPYALLALVLGALFLRFFLRLPSRYRWIFGICGALYAGAALLFEMWEAAYTEKHGEEVLGYAILYTFEENFEILALLVTNWGMMDYLAKHCAGLSLTLKVE